MKQNEFLKNYKYELFLGLILSVFSVFFFYSHGNIATDIGREALIPSAILKGDILYGNILNIYAPASYFINAVFYKIFGVRLETLYFAGSITAVIFLFCVYKIFNQFVSKKLSFVFTLVIVSSCIYNSGLYNFLMPYSFAVIYGLMFYSLSLLMILFFIDKKDDKFLYVSALFAGFSFANKIEFLPAVLIIFFVLFCQKFNKTDCILKTLLCFSVFPFIFYMIPVIQGLDFEGIKNAVDIFLKSSAVPSVTHFAMLIGTVFAPRDILLWGESLLKLFVFLIIGYFWFKFFKNKIALFFGFLILSVLLLFLQFETMFSYLAVFVALYLVFSFKKLYENNFKILTVLLFALGGSVKTLFKIYTNEYGAFTFPLLFLALVCILFTEKDKFQKILFDDKKNESFILFLTGVMIFCNVFFNCIKLNFYSCKIQTPFGTVATSKDFQRDSQRIISSVYKNTKENDKILFLPEGSLFNFLCNRPTDMQMYALNSPYIETYGEKFITDRIETSKINYIAVIKGLGLFEFDEKNPDFYFKDNEITGYIRQKYAIIDSYKSQETAYLLFKRK